MTYALLLLVAALSLRRMYELNQINTGDRQVNAWHLVFWTIVNLGLFVPGLHWMDNPDSTLPFEKFVLFIFASLMGIAFFILLLSETYTYIIEQWQKKIGPET